MWTGDPASDRINMVIGEIKVSHRTSMRLKITTPLPHIRIRWRSLRCNMKPSISILGRRKTDVVGVLLIISNLHSRQLLIESKSTSESLSIRTVSSVVDVSCSSLLIDHWCQTRRMKWQDYSKSRLVQGFFRLSADMMCLTG